MNIYQRLSNVISQMPSFEADGKNGAQNYTFISIYKMYNVLRRMLAKEGIVQYPGNIISQEMEVIEIDKGKYVQRLYYAEATVEYVFACGSGDDEQIKVRVLGAASDYSDKAQNQAMTSAHKNALKQLFMIAEGDPDEKGHEVNLPAITEAQLKEMETAFEMATSDDHVTTTIRKYIHMKDDARFAAAGKAARARFEKKEEPQPQTETA